MALLPLRGEIWLADLNPPRDHEQAERPPVLIGSMDAFNHGPADLVFVLPLTRTDRRIPLHVLIDPPMGGVNARSFVLCDALRSISQARLVDRPWGAVMVQTMRKVEDMLRVLLEL